MAQGTVQYPGQGCIVEFMQDNAPQIGIVLEEKKERLRLLLPNRRESVISSSRVLPWSGPVCSASNREDMIRFLESRREIRAEAEKEINTQELWELASGDLDRATAQWFAELIFPAPTADDIAACGHALMQAKTHFRFTPPVFEIYDAATVTRRIQELEKQKEREQLISRGSAFFRRLQEHGRSHPDVPVPDEDIQDIATTLRRMLLTRIADPDTKEEEALWNIVTRGLAETPYLPLLLAESWGIVPPHHNFWLDRADYDPVPDWQSVFADTLREKSSLAESYRESIVFGQPLLSIDAETTKDMDDAFTLEKHTDGSFKLTVALACPALNWSFGSAFDKAVSHRATSLYLPEGTWNMLPNELAENAFSLKSGSPRPALIVVCHISTNGEILSCEPSIATVTVNANLAYTECETALDGATTPASPYLETLRFGLELAEILKRRRIEQGAVIIDRPDLHIELSGTGREIQVSMYEEPPCPRAHLIVSEQMVLINTALARWAIDHNAGLLYRTQDVAIPKEFAGEWNDPVDISRVVRALAPAVMETTPRPHAGLGTDVYATVSSPLRRYADLVNEAQILSILQNGVAALTTDELDALLIRLNARLDAVTQVQRMRPRYWKLLALKQQGDKVWRKAIITDENDMFLTATLPQEQIFVRARRALFNEKAHIGMPIEVRIGKINPLQNDFQLLETREIEEILN
ncbi:MAG: ribonuclease catalytic domain-containing protein [Desulfovibrionaceae bacterium]|nr:ribonuclease catalytic domain-containing protein [Desulfovibrionaceae bacterium]